MATLLQLNVDQIMRWLRANGIQHGPDEIIADSVHVRAGVIEYDTVGRIGGLHRIPHRVPEKVTYRQANADA